MRHIGLAVMAAGAALSLCSCASDMHKDTGDAQSYQRQRAIASSISNRNERDHQMERQAQQEHEIERIGGSPVPRR